MSDAATWFAPSRPFNVEVSLDAIRHFVEGYGDLRRIHRNEDYAARTRWVGVVAPPLFYWTVGEPLPGDAPLEWSTMPPEVVLARPVAERWTFERPLRPGDEVQARVRVHADDGAMILDRLYVDPDGHRLATCRSEHRRWTTAPAAAERPSRDELVALEMELRSEVHQRAAVLADIVPGTCLPSRRRGPLSTTDLVVQVMGIGFGDNTGWAPLSSLTTPGWWTMLEGAAVETACHPAVDWGRLRTLWMCSLVLDWAGDDAVLEAFDYVIFEPAWEGDVSTLDGTVVDTDGDRMAVVNTSCTNRAGRVTACATATLDIRSKYQ